MRSVHHHRRVLRLSKLVELQLLDQVIELPALLPMRRRLALSAATARATAVSAAAVPATVEPAALAAAALASPAVPATLAAALATATLAAAALATAAVAGWRVPYPRPARLPTEYRHLQL